MSIYDGLPDIFTESLGESVVYTPLATGIPAAITAIWDEQPIQVPFNEVPTGDSRVELHVRAQDIPSPTEGDLVFRPAKNVTRRVVSPISPDGKGMISVALAKVS